MDDFLSISVQVPKTVNNHYPTTIKNPLGEICHILMVKVMKLTLCEIVNKVMKLPT